MMQRFTSGSLIPAVRWALALGAIGTSGCLNNSPAPPPVKSPAGGLNVVGSASSRNTRPAVDLESSRPRVEAFCGGCHAVPLAGSFPKKAWPEEVNRGFNIFLGSGRGDLMMPPVAEVIEYFRSQAPEQLQFAPQDPVPADSPFRFRVEPWIPLQPTEVPGVAALSLQCRSAGTACRLFTCDMASGGVEVLELGPEVSATVRLATLSQPCHVEPVDFDGDGRDEYVVAALGSFQPGDHDRGKVWLVRDVGTGENGTKGDTHVEPVLLQGGLGRVADVRPADFDGDGDIDLVVGEFGFIKTGRILLLRNRGESQSPPTFDLEQLDDRHGTIHVPVCDLDQDGMPDFVACISQDHETVVAFLNRGNGTFDRRTVFEAGDPAFGSNGIQLVDFDLDGDLDVVATNGDTLDSKFLKPYHGVQWLENRGEFPFTRHQIAFMPGVSRALAADFDSDGDLDVFAIAFFPANLRQLPDAPQLESAVVFENAGDGGFRRHRLETGNLEHMCLELGDIDEDGDIDALIGNCASDPDHSPTGKPHVTIWRNLSRD